MVLLLKPASGRCNADCGYCFYKKTAAARACSDRGIMSIDTFSAILDKIAACGEREAELIFQGGEPTLAGLDFYRAAVKLQKQYQRIRFYNTIQTNGLLIDGKWADFSAENGFYVGLSLDGTADTHGLYRSDFERVFAAAKLLQSRGVPLSILTVVTDRLTSRAAEIYAFYRENGFTRQQYIPALPPEDGNAPLLSAQSYGEFLITLFDLWYDDIMRGDDVCVSYFDDLAALSAGCAPGSCGRLGRCAPQYAVESDGSVYVCDFYCDDRHFIGNLITDGFEKLEAGREKLGFIAQSARLGEKCRNCDCLDLCRGGCRRNRDERGLNAFCDAYRVFLPHARPKIIKILKAKGILK